MNKICFNQEVTHRHQARIHIHIHIQIHIHIHLHIHSQPIEIPFRLATGSAAIGMGGWVGWGVGGG